MFWGNCLLKRQVTTYTMFRGTLILMIIASLFRMTAYLNSVLLPMVLV